DPFKYGSFAVNAGDQVYRLTGEIQSQLEAHGATGALNRFPPVLAFQSVVDATVSIQAVVERLFKRLPDGGHELVLFDINRMTEVEYVLTEDPTADLEAMLDDTSLPFTVSLLTNENEESRHVVVRQKRPDDPERSERSVGLTWPDELYSLSHVAMPIPATDPLYGRSKSRKNGAIHLGNIALRGERGVLQVPAADMLRLRWNPFYPYIERRLLEFVRLEAPLGVGAE
ncbi:MAG: alpha/beta hydrolase, partial [Nitrospiraceae bacterium]